MSKKNNKISNKSKKKNYKIKNIQIPLDLPIKPIKSKKGESIILQLELIYEKKLNNIKYNILKYIDIDDNKNIIIQKDFIDNHVYNILKNTLNLYIENNIPFNKSHLVYINNHNNKIIEKFFSLKSQSIYKLVKYFSEDNNKILSKIGNYNSYYYNELNNNLNLSNLAFNEREMIRKEVNLTDKKKVRKITEDFARGVSQYLKKNYELSSPVSNAFVKLWEIYSVIPKLLPNKKTVRIFHMAEAPGNWINCTSRFIASKRDKIEEYDWRANSLNPKSTINIKKYGKDIFSDDHGFMRKYKERWLFGKDDTGDITNLSNIKWFKKYIKQWCGNNKLDLITGDAGLYQDDVDLEILQKIDLAQMIMVAYLSSKGGNCVIKHFTPFMNTKHDSYKASGYFVSYLYLYYLMFDEVRIIKPHTSNPNSGEFYLVGLKFKGLDENIKNKLLKHLDNFKENMTLFKKDDIPEEFSYQITNFINEMTKNKIIQYDMQNMLFTCIKKEEPELIKLLKCNKYLNSKYIDKIQESRFKEWIKMYKFEN